MTWDSPYLPSSRWDDLLVADAEGMPPLRLREYRGALWLSEDSTGLLVNVGNKHLRRLGIWSAAIRGTAHYDQSNVGIGEASLVREPDNPFDANAVAVHVGGSCVGHFNKQMAAGLARNLDSGGELEAFVISAGAGTRPKVIAATPEVMAHLKRT